MNRLPTVDTTRFSAIAPEDVMLSYLACAGGSVTPARLHAALKPFVPRSESDELVRRLRDGKQIQVEGKISLTADGLVSARKALGRDVDDKWEVVRRRRLPMLALGLDPEDAKAVQAMARHDALKAATIAVAFGLPKDGMMDVGTIMGHLVWRTLRCALSGIVGDGPFPAIAKPGAVERTILAGLAGKKARSVTEAVNKLAAASCGMERYDIDELRRRLVEIGLRSVVAPTGHPPSAEDDFAGRVNTIAASLTTPPFDGRVAISQLYDAYGRVHADAGPMVKFKERLVACAKAQELVLGRLDLPERLDRDLRTRSETPWNDETVHFVITQRG